jgi:flagella basal body P-ring formation protein FlgA
VDTTLLISRLLRLAVLTLAVLGVCNTAFAAPPAEAGSLLQLQARQFATRNVVAPEGGRFELVMGDVDARLRLAPCNEVQPYLPSGVKLWGKSRIGLRCVNGAIKWNVYLPVTVHIYGKALVATTPLSAGHVLDQADLKLAEINLTEDPQPALTIAGMAVGRTLARPLAAGQALRQHSMKARQWFNIGDSVAIHAVGSGFAASGRGEALTKGMEGQAARVRTESGRVVSGMPVAEQQLEIAL